MYSKIANLPLMLGISSETILELQDRMMLQEEILCTGETIVKSSDRCCGLLWVSKGKVTRIASVAEGISLKETLISPLVIEPETLMGIDNKYRDTYIADTETNVLYIAKEHVGRVLMRKDFFRINILSMMSTIAQRFRASTLLPFDKDNELTFLRFIERVRLQKDSELTMMCTMNALAKHLNMTRLNLSRVLNKMKSEDKLTLGREIIKIR